MKIVDAVWEKRNLGVETAEIVIEQNDSLEAVKNILNTMQAEYMVLKIPAGRTEVMFAAEEEKFHFVEGIIHVTHNLKNITLSAIQRRIDTAVSYEKMTEKDLKELYTEIKKDLFDTDRISIDPAFTKGQAANRYIGWISDELARNCDIYKLVYKNETVGFFTFKETEQGVFYPFLAGMYKKYQTSPLGAVYNYKPILEAQKRQGRMISTYVSTNNHNALRAHVMYGFQFCEISYVYIKHNKKSILM